MISGLIPEGTERELIDRLIRSDPRIKEMLLEMIVNDPPEYVRRMAENLHTYLCPNHKQESSYCNYYEEERADKYWLRGVVHKQWVRYALKLLSYFDNCAQKFNSVMLQRSMKDFEDMKGGERIVFMLFLNNELEEARELMESLKPPIAEPQRTLPTAQDDTSFVELLDDPLVG